jgi:hypothetical protein
MLYQQQGIQDISITWHHKSVTYLDKYLFTLNIYSVNIFLLQFTLHIKYLQ